jgi:hypothetical protein
MNQEEEMRTTIALALAALVGAVGFAAHAEDPAGPPGPRPGACGPRGHGARFYDPNTVTTVSGEVAAVETWMGRRGGGPVRLDLATAEGTLSVRVGPAWFLEEQGLRIAKGDKLEITGSKVSFRGAPALIAQVVKKGETAVALRDIAGVPVWAGRGR